jgi:hypothetical protein
MSISTQLCPSVYHLVYSFRSPYLFYLLTVDVEVVYFHFITLRHTPQSVGLLWTKDRPVADNTNTHKRQKIPVGIRTHDPSKRSTADLRLRPRGHWDRPCGRLVTQVLSKVTWHNLFREAMLLRPWDRLCKATTTRAASCVTSLRYPNHAIHCFRVGGGGGKGRSGVRLSKCMWLHGSSSF